MVCNIDFVVECLDILYHYDLYVYIAELHDEDAISLKKSQVYSMTLRIYLLNSIMGINLNLLNHFGQF